MRAPTKKGEKERKDKGMKIKVSKRQKKNNVS